MFVDRFIDPLLSWVGRFLSKKGHTAVAALFFGASESSASYEHAYVLWQENDFDAAQAHIEEVLAKNPGHPEGNNLAGILALHRGDELLAADFFQRALSVRQSYPAAHNNLGNVYRAQGALRNAIASYRTALAIDPSYVESLTNLGAVLNLLGSHTEAEDYCRQAIECAPDYAGAYCNLGNALLSLGRGGEAVSAYRQALKIEPGLPEALINLSLVLEEPAYLAGVVEYYEEQLSRHPENYISHLRVAQALQAQDKWDEARVRIEKALELSPDATDALMLLANNSSHSGEAVHAIELYRKIVGKERNAGAHSGLVFNLLYVENIDGATLCDEYRSWAKLHAPSTPSPHHWRTGRGDRLRVGYLSRDFCTHSVAYFLEPILEQHDRDTFEIFCYSTLLTPDSTTERFKSLADSWRDISMLSIDDAERAIRDDEIDILVDLSGHTAGNRLPVFARRPAPVQITYLGHPTTTGLADIDYRIGDHLTDPEGLTEKHYTERLWRLPGCFLTYKPSPVAPQVTTAPSAKSNCITFGSFNNALKITPAVIAVWARIMQQVKDSRLILKSHSFGTVAGNSRLIEGFLAHGINGDRLQLMEWLPAGQDHLSIYSEVDIALDPFPYNGTTTTCEALWMGVPVISLCGDRHSSRVGASLLTNLGLNELVCTTVDDYVRCATSLAFDKNRLISLRASLRKLMTESPLLNHSGFTHNLEDAYRAMWSQWSASADIDESKEIGGTGNELRLHIGGTEHRDGWTILNISAGPDVDIVGDIKNLTAIKTGEVTEIYASHVLEHVDQQTIPRVLREFRRILKKPGGKLSISVPDLEVLCRLFLREDIGPQGRQHVMRMIFGGQVDDHDYHETGLYFEYLRDLLSKAGFRGIEKVDSFGLFDDTSDYAPYGQKISLNVIATT